MVRYRCKLIKNKVDYADEENTQAIEMWTTFSIDNLEIEVFLDNFYVLPYDNLKGKEYDVDFKLMTYDIYRINIEEKILKQISTGYNPPEEGDDRGWPSTPMYFLMGEVVNLKEVEIESRGEKKKSMWLKIDCGIEIETRTGRYVAFELRKGDYVAIIGKMFGEVVKG